MRTRRQNNDLCNVILVTRQEPTSLMQTTAKVVVQTV